MEGAEILNPENVDLKARVLCCDCGTPIEPNVANMCVACLRQSVDITADIAKQGMLNFCKSCERYLQPPNNWIKCPLESRELLTLCLKKMRGLNKVRLVDAGFVWTEPHSKRIKVRLSVQKDVSEVSGNAASQQQRAQLGVGAAAAPSVLQETFVVEFVVHWQMCTDCHRVEAKDFWKAVVQIRQKTDHKRTIFFLEQLILKHKAHSNCLRLKPEADGIDFFFATKSDARKFVDFINTVVPCRYKTSERLISHDIHSNVFNYKHTFSVEIVPVCKDEVVCLPQKLARQLGNIAQVCVCTRITNTVHLIDPASCQVAELPATVYWRTPFQALFSLKQLTEYIVLQVEYSDQQARTSRKHVLADLWVQRASSLGTEEGRYHCKTHLGHILKIGDTVLGHDFAHTNVSDLHLEKMKQDKIPDVVIVKKSYSMDDQMRRKRRVWKLKRLNANLMDMGSKQYQDFLADLEEDQELRRHVNIYKDGSRVAVEKPEAAEATSEDEDAPPVISLQEMLDDFHMSDTDDMDDGGGPQPTDQGADMAEDISET